MRPEHDVRPGDLGTTRLPLLGTANLRRLARTLLPAFSLAVILIAIAWLNPRAISYFGFSLMLNLAIPIALATLAQMFVITGNDLDLSIGTFVGFVGCVTATWLRRGAAVRGADPARLDRRLRLPRRAHPPAQHPLDRGDARHELRLARPGDPAAAEAGRQRAGLAACGHVVQAALRAAADRACHRHRHRRADRADALVLRRGAQGLGRQSRRRSAAPAGRCSPPRSRCSRWPAFSACCPAWR